MAGVKPISVGGSPADGRAALVEYAERVRGAPQPAVSLHNGRRLDGRGSHAFVGFIHWKNMDILGDSSLSISVDHSILDRANLLSSAEGKHRLCIDPHRPVVHPDTHQRI